MSDLEAGGMVQGEGVGLDSPAPPSEGGEFVAGEALDYLIAEHVLGWRKKFVSFSVGGVNWYWIPSKRASTQTPRAYSTDIAAAWDVVEQFWSVTIDCCEGVIPPYNVTITARGGLETWEGWADTAPLAICRAALEAKGVDPDEHQLESAGDKQAAQTSAAAHPGHKETGE